MRFFLIYLAPIIHGRCYFYTYFQENSHEKYKPIDWGKCSENQTPIGNPNNCLVADILPDGKLKSYFK